jgi:hypothetical protein
MSARALSNSQPNFFGEVNQAVFARCFQAQNQVVVLFVSHHFFQLARAVVHKPAYTSFVAAFQVVLGFARMRMNHLVGGETNLHGLSEFAIRAYIHAGALFQERLQNNFLVIGLDRVVHINLGHGIFHDPVIVANRVFGINQKRTAVFFYQGLCLGKIHYRFGDFEGLDVSGSNALDVFVHKA